MPFYFKTYISQATEAIDGFKFPTELVITTLTDFERELSKHLGRKPAPEPKEKGKPYNETELRDAILAAISATGLADYGIIVGEKTISVARPPYTYWVPGDSSTSRGIVSYPLSFKGKQIETIYETQDKDKIVTSRFHLLSWITIEGSEEGQ